MVISALNWIRQIGLLNVKFIRMLRPIVAKIRVGVAVDVHKDGCDYVLRMRGDESGVLSVRTLLTTLLISTLCPYA